MAKARRAWARRLATADEFEAALEGALAYAGKGLGEVTLGRE